MPDAEGAVERLYEDADVRDELRDDEAALLLKWAEGQLNKLAEQSATDEEFDAKAAQFRALLKGMNRLVGNRATLDEAALNARLAELSAQATSVATPTGQLSAQTAVSSIPADQLKGMAGKLPTLDDVGAVTALMALFAPVPQAQAAAPATQVAQTPASAAEATAETPVPQAAPSAESPTAPAFDAENGLFHRLSIHFWPSRKKNPPQ